MSKKGGIQSEREALAELKAILDKEVLLLSSLPRFPHTRVAIGVNSSNNGCVVFGQEE